MSSTDDTEENCDSKECIFKDGITTKKEGFSRRMEIGGNYKGPKSKIEVWGIRVVLRG